jgi:hypothetical protein
MQDDGMRGYIIALPESEGRHVRTPSDPDSGIMKKSKRVSKKALALLRLKNAKVTRLKNGSTFSFRQWLVRKGLVEQVTLNLRNLKIPKKKKIPKKQTRCVVIKPNVDALLLTPGPLQPLYLKAKTTFPLKTARTLIREDCSRIKITSFF